MFKAKCKCIDCENLEDGIYFQKNECYNRIRLHITQAMENALELNNADLYMWLKELRKNLETFKEYYD